MVGESDSDLDLRCARRASSAARKARQLARDRAQAAACASHATAATAWELAPPMELDDFAGAQPTNENAAKARVESRVAMLQRARLTDCGDQPMLCVPLVGRAVRVWDRWYALCTLCAAPFEIVSFSAMRVGDALCCMRCDAASLRRADAERPTDAAAERLACAACGCRQPSARSAASSRWRVVAAPLDTSPANARLRPADRTLAYCPKHAVHWLAAAHRQHRSTVVFAHLMRGVCPPLAD